MKVSEANAKAIQSMKVDVESLQGRLRAIKVQAEGIPGAKGFVRKLDGIQKAIGKALE